MVQVIFALVALIGTSCALAQDSVVIGRGISNAYLASISCDAVLSCLDAEYLWVLEAHRTLVGPSVKGRIRAVSIQHTDATQRFVSSVELFVLRPIKTPADRASLGADFSIIALSPRYSSGRYCLNLEPNSIGLHIDSAKVHKSEGSYCFAASLLADQGV
jgi:hypothetical protein